MYFICVFFQYILIYLVFLLLCYFVLSFSVLPKTRIIYSLELHVHLSSFQSYLTRGGRIIIAPNLWILTRGWDACPRDKDRSNKSGGERLWCGTYDSFRYGFSQHSFVNLQQRSNEITGKHSLLFLLASSPFFFRIEIVIYSNFYNESLSFSFFTTNSSSAQFMPKARFYFP